MSLRIFVPGGRAGYEARARPLALAYGWLKRQGGETSGDRTKEGCIRASSSKARPFPVAYFEDGVAGGFR
jgi:hypothetical protein